MNHDGECRTRRCSHRLSAIRIPNQPGPEAVLRPGHPDGAGCWSITAPALAVRADLITYCWIEHRDSGDVERQHTRAGHLAGPRLRHQRRRLPRSDHEMGADEPPGPGPGGCSAHARLLRWPERSPRRPDSLASASSGATIWRCTSLIRWKGKTDDRNPDGGGDLTDGIIAPPDTYVSAKWMPTNVMFARRRFAGHHHRSGRMRRRSPPSAFTPARKAASISPIRTRSPSKLPKTARRSPPAGSAQFKQVFDPPADYLPWELDQSSALRRPSRRRPAGIRLPHHLSPSRFRRYVRASARPARDGGCCCRRSRFSIA